LHNIYVNHDVDEYLKENNYYYVIYTYIIIKITSIRLANLRNENLIIFNKYIWLIYIIELNHLSYESSSYFYYTIFEPI